VCLIRRQFFIFITRVHIAPSRCHSHLPVWIHSPEDGLKFWIFLALLHYRQIVTEGTQAGLEFLMIQVTSLVLVKVPGKIKVFQTERSIAYLTGAHLDITCKQGWTGILRVEKDMEVQCKHGRVFSRPTCRSYREEGLKQIDSEWSEMERTGKRKKNIW